MSQNPNLSTEKTSHSQQSDRKSGFQCQDEYVCRYTTTNNDDYINHSSNLKQITALPRSHISPAIK